MRLVATSRISDLDVGISRTGLQISPEPVFMVRVVTCVRYAGLHEGSHVSKRDSLHICLEIITRDTGRLSSASDGQMVYCRHTVRAITGLWSRHFHKQAQSNGFWVYFANKSYVTSQEQVVDLLGTAMPTGPIGVAVA
ncbi:hypothetical protein Bbelb_151720 [Branchiostoma belcheri]|nr:hypothetical protein Bbelb_151720 [Branchiostoma belcheri]